MYNLQKLSEELLTLRRIMGIDNASFIMEDDYTDDERDEEFVEVILPVPISQFKVWRAKADATVFIVVTHA